MKTSIIALVIVLIFNSKLQADTISITKGLEKIKNNLNISVKNKEDYDKNLQIVNGNIQSIKKNKDISMQQKKYIANEIYKSDEAYKKLSQQEKELAHLLDSELAKSQSEEKQLQQLQLLAEQIKKNQEQRKLIISEYQNQLKEVNLRKTDWKDRESKLKVQENQNSDEMGKIASEETIWQNKKGIYDKELKKWASETTRTQKINDTFQGLTEGK